MKFVQKLGKALMLPVACLPICGILMGLGYAMCPSTMQGGDVTGVVEQIGFFLVKAGGALIDHMALLFAIGVGVGMSDDHDGTAGLAALASWLMITNLHIKVNQIFYILLIIFILFLYLYVFCDSFRYFLQKQISDILFSSDLCLKFGFAY